MIKISVLWYSIKKISLKQYKESFNEVLVWHLFFNELFLKRNYLNQVLLLWFKTHSMNSFKNWSHWTKVKNVSAELISRGEDIYVSPQSGASEPQTLF